MGLFSRQEDPFGKNILREISETSAIAGTLHVVMQESLVIQVCIDEKSGSEAARIVDVENTYQNYIILRSYQPLDVQNGDIISVVVETSVWRYIFTTKVEQCLEGNKYLCPLPDVLADGERRQSFRMRCRKGEAVPVIVTVDRTAGPVATGILSEISKLGICFRPLQIIENTTGKLLGLLPDLFPTGMEIFQVRIAFPGQLVESDFPSSVQRTWGIGRLLTVALEFSGGGRMNPIAVTQLIDSRFARQPVRAPLFADEYRNDEETPSEEVPSSEDAGSIADPEKPEYLTTPPEQTHETAAVAKPEPVATGPRIVVLGDKDRFGARMAATLHSLGLTNIHCIGSARELFEGISGSSCALLIASAIMKDVPIVQLAKAMKSRQELARIPIIVVTEPGIPCDITGLVSAGVFHILSKPLSPAVLSDRIKKLIPAQP